jgi:uncharacterized protein YaaN involved in tellurite resistance
MDDFTPDKPAESTAIVTAQQYSAEIKKTPALAPLSKEKMARAVELSEGLVRDEDQLDDIVTFGNDAQAAVTRITKDMLSGVRVGALDDVVRLSDDVLTEVHTLDVADLMPGPRRGFLGIPEAAAAIKQRIKDFFRRYELVNTRLDRQEAQIFAREAASTDRYRRDRALAKATLDALLDAQVRVMAIKLFLEGEHGYRETQLRLQAVNAEKEAAQSEGRSMDYLTVASADRYGKYVERLETKATALQKLIISAYQMNVTIRMMGDNENIIRQKLSDIRNELLPQWRTMIAIAYQAYQQQGISQFVADLTRAETDMQHAMGRQLERTAEGVAALMTQPVIDVNAMKDYNEKLVSSLDKLKTASVEARKIRDAAEGEMQKLIHQLGEATSSIVAGEKQA